MRALFTYAGGSGHAEPMVPVARALMAAGHTVAFTGAARPLAGLAARGFETIPLGPPATPDSAVEPPTTGVQPLIEPDQAHEEEVVRRHYATRAPERRAPLYAEMFETWRPDIVVRDEMDFGSGIVAEARGIPRAVVIVIGAGGFVRPDVVAEPLDAVRAQYGLPPDPDLASLGQDVVLSPFAPSFRDPAFPLPETTQYFRADGSEPRSTLPEWWSTLDDRPTVYLTLGTVFPLESGDLFRRLLAGLSELPVNVITTVGHDLDPAVLQPQPTNVRVEQWLPHDLVLSTADLVVSHGGSGTVASALAHGLPQIVVAMGADQMLNSRRVEALGVGRALHPVSTTPSMVRHIAGSVLNDSGIREAAASMQREIDAMPLPERAVPALERLTPRNER